jgi:hypothetical protein
MMEPGTLIAWPCLGIAAIALWMTLTTGIKGWRARERSHD